MNNTVIRMSVQRMVCTGCGSEANATCDCGVSYVAKGVRAAQAIKANPKRSDGAIAADLGVDRSTVSRARSDVVHDAPPDDERTGRDGKSYSIRQRVTDDPDLPPKLIEDAAATNRRRVFLRCADDVLRKAEQGAGLKEAKEPEIDDEILVTLDKVINAWIGLREEILNRKGR